MLTALTWLAGSTFLLGGLAILYRVEDSFGGRIVFVRLRQAGDNLLSKVQHKIGAHHMQGIDYVRLTWHYVIHIFLRRIMKGVTWLQRRLEETQLRNREAAKIIRAGTQTSHLTEIAIHKESTALSEAERERRKAH